MQKSEYRLFVYPTLARSIGLLLSVYLAAMLNAAVPLLRFQNGPLNYFFFAAIQLLPWGAVLAARRLKGWPRWALSIPSFLLAVISTPLGLIAGGCTVNTMTQQVDSSFERMTTIATERGTVTVYRTNGGALDHFGIVVRQECAVLPGLLVVRNLATEPAVRRSAIDVLPKAQLLISFPDFDKNIRTQPPSRMQELASLPCFWARTS